jgi:hypothetical protein
MNALADASPAGLRSLRPPSALLAEGEKPSSLRRAEVLTWALLLL